MHCPSCKHEIPPEEWAGRRQVRCDHCGDRLEFIPFPALSATRTVARSEAAELGADATCFFHAANRATAVCSSCGRLLCSVCAVDFAGQCLCPSCIAQRPATRPENVKTSILWDGIALMTALLPLLMWPITLVTAPTAIGLAIYGWNKPCSLVRGSRVRLVLALLAASAQVVGWGIGLYVFLRTAATRP